MGTPIPAEVIFNPHWWHRNYGSAFDESFYFDRALRIQNDLQMRRALYERFRLGKPNPGPRPMVGSEHVAGGFVMPALFGCKIRFEADAAPTPVPRDLGAEEALAVTAPDFAVTWPMQQLIADLDSLQEEFGCVCGDFNLDGALNTALKIRGQQLFTDFYEAPQLARHPLSKALRADSNHDFTSMRRRAGRLAQTWLSMSAFRDIAMCKSLWDRRLPKARVCASPLLRRGTIWHLTRRADGYRL